jgi:hypothetical protein
MTDGRTNGTVFPLPPRGTRSVRSRMLPSVGAGLRTRIDRRQPIRSHTNTSTPDLEALEGGHQGICASVDFG